MDKLQSGDFSIKPGWIIHLESFASKKWFLTAVIDLWSRNSVHNLAPRFTTDNSRGMKTIVFHSWLLFTLVQYLFSYTTRQKINQVLIEKNECPFYPITFLSKIIKIIIKYKKNEKSSLKKWNKIIRMKFL